MSNPYIPNLDPKAVPVAADLFIIADSADSNLEKKTTVQQVIFNNSYYRLIQSQTAAASAVIDFTNLSSSYKRYIVVVSALVPAALNQKLLLRTSTDNGSTFTASAGAYAFTQQFISNVDGTVLNNYSGGSGATSINVSQSLDNTLSNSFSIQIDEPMLNTVSTQFSWGGYQCTAPGIEGGLTGGGRRAVAEANNAIRFLMDTGNIASGVFSLYAIT